MSHFIWRLPSLLVGSVLAFGLLFLNVHTALALDQAPGSVVITAVIAPVRYVLITKTGNIKEILSNTSQDVRPVTYVDSFNSQPISMGKQLTQKYQTIINTVNTYHCGVIYSMPSNQLSALITGLNLVYLSKTESVLFKTMR